MKQGKILIVEDDKIDQMAFEEFAKEEDLPYDYRFAGSVTEAEKLLKNDRYDMVLMDYLLGDGTAFDLFDKMDGVPFIIITGTCDEEVAVKAMKSGAYDFIIKDTDGNYLKTLPVTVDNAINRKRVEDELIRYREHLEELVKERTTELQTEIAERKRVEKALRENKAFNFALFQYNPIETIVVNLEGRVTAFNLAKKKSGDKLPMIGDVMYKDYAANHEIDMYSEMMNCIRTGETKRFPEMEYEGKFLSITISPFPKGAIIACEDISERVHAEREKQNIQTQLLQAQKMEAIGVLAGGIAHDFNNLITAIQGFTDMAMLRIEPENPLYMDLQEVRVASKRATELTQQLLLFSRKQPMEFASLDINATMDGLLKMLHRLIGEDISIGTDLQPNLWTVWADVGNVEQVIMNLVVNARDAMPEGGKLTIKTENVVLNEAYVKLMPEARSGKFVRFVLSDTGVGMDAATLQHIFEPFFSTKGMGKGTGLGLSVVYGIVKQHDGWVNVYSEPGQGTTFKIYFPAITAKADATNKEAIPINKLEGHGERILVVEDARSVREFASKALRRNGFEVFEAETMEEAIRVFDKEKANFDLILCDVVLPDGSGVDLVDVFLARNKDIEVILSSGYTDQKSQWPVIKERGLTFLPKPYSFVKLIQVVHEGIRKQKKRKPKPQKKETKAKKPQKKTKKS